MVEVLNILNRHTAKALLPANIILLPNKAMVAPLKVTATTGLVVDTNNNNLCMFNNRVDQVVVEPVLQDV